MTAHFPGLLFTTAWQLRSADSPHIAPPAGVPGREGMLSLSSQLPSVNTAEHTPTPTDNSTEVEGLVQILPTSVPQADESHTHRTFPCQQYL